APVQIRDRQSGARTVRPRRAAGAHACRLVESDRAAPRARRKREPGRAVRRQRRRAGRHHRVFARAGGGDRVARSPSAPGGDRARSAHPEDGAAAARGCDGARVLRIPAAAGCARDFRALRVRSAASACGERRRAASRREFRPRGGQRSGEAASVGGPYERGARKRAPRTGMTMEWQALTLSLRLAGWTVVVLLPIGILIARALAWHRFAGRRLTEAALALPLVLPP